MITDAVWIDLTGDNRKDLIVVGDWMAPKIFENKVTFLSEKDTNLSSVSGWWNKILTGDFDNDGDVDFIIGNKGTNSVYLGSEAFPAKMFINDFDNNGTLDQIHTHTIDGKDKPIHVRNELITQIRSLKRENSNFTDYAGKSIDQLFKKQFIENAIVKKVNQSKSIIALNQGNLQFEFFDLPFQAQWNSINTGIVKDFNKDGNLDLVVAGGEEYLKPQFSKLDAGYGELLYGDGMGNFDWIPYKKSGLKIKGVVRNLSEVKMGEYDGYIFGINNNKPLLYVMEPK